MSADWDGEIGNAVPASVWHGRARRYQLPSPYLTREHIVEFMKDAAPLCEIVCDEYEERWNGSNHVGELTEEGEDAEFALRSMLESHRIDSDYEIVVMDAGDWYEPCQDEILDRLVSGEDAATVLDQMKDEYHYDHRPLVIERVNQYIEYLEELLHERIEAHLERIAVDLSSVGPVSAIAFDLAGDDIRFWDDHEDVTLPYKVAVGRLERLADEAGLDAFWSAMVLEPIRRENA